MTNYVGQQFGDYRLIKHLGNGTFGDVYQAEHIHLETYAAVKLLRGDFTPQEIDIFRNEARLLVRLEHPHIIRVLTYSIETHDGQDIPYLVMSFALNGTVLDNHPRGKPLPLTTIVTYVKQIASALQYAHDERYIHRDVKPENILLGKNDELLLSDFGIAVVAHSTRSWVIQKPIGSWAYAAPEQFVGKAVPASDQYSLAVVVYEWLCGERPFHGDAFQLVNQHRQNIPPPPLHEKMDISPAIEQVIMRALAKAPEQRFESVQAFANALVACSDLGSHSKPNLTAPTIPVTTPRLAPTIPVTTPQSVHRKTHSPSGTKLMSWIILDIIALSFYSRLIWQLSVIQLVHAFVGPLPYDYNTVCPGFAFLSWTSAILVLLDILIAIGMFVVGPIGVIISGVGILQVLITRHVDWLKRGSILLLVGFASIVALVIWARITFAFGICSYK